MPTATPEAVRSKSSPIPTSNPLPLSAGQEAQVRDVYYAKVRGLCAEEIRTFAMCARNRTISATWMCRAERKAMNSCMVANATPENMDAAREEWFQKRIAMRKAREEEARRAKREQEGEE